MNIKVENINSPRSGNPVANQYIIWVDNKEYFQSYDSIIAVRDHAENGNITLDEYYWDYSVTTGKYRREFLGEGVAVTREKIASGEYKLANLNY